MNDSIQIADYTLMTVVRPSGVTEIVRRDGGMSPQAFAKFQAATRAAGKGELVSFEVVMRTAVVAGYAAAVRAEKAADAARAAIYRAMDARPE